MRWRVVKGFDFVGAGVRKLGLGRGVGQGRGVGALARAGVRWRDWGGLGRRYLSSLRRRACDAGGLLDARARSNAPKRCQPGVRAGFDTLGIHFVCGAVVADFGEAAVSQGDLRQARQRLVVGVAAACGSCSGASRGVVVVAVMVVLEW